MAWYIVLRNEQTFFSKIWFRIQTKHLFEDPKGEAFGFY